MKMNRNDRPRPTTRASCDGDPGPASAPGSNGPSSQNIGMVDARDGVVKQERQGRNRCAFLPNVTVGPAVLLVTSSRSVRVIVMELTYPYLVQGGSAAAGRRCHRGRGSHPVGSAWANLPAGGTLLVRLEAAHGPHSCDMIIYRFGSAIFRDTRSTQGVACQRHCQIRIRHQRDTRSDPYRS